MAVEATKAPRLTPEKKIERQQKLGISRTIGRSLFLSEFKAKNPAGTKELRTAAWAEQGKEFRKKGLKVVNALEKQGFSIVKTG